MSLRAPTTGARRLVAPIDIYTLLLNFISFGSGSSGNCYYFYNDTDTLMVDAGTGVRLLKRNFSVYGLSLSRVSNILITHDHADHVKSVGSISHSLGIPVWATAKTHEGIQHNYSAHRKVASELRRTIEPGQTYSVGAFGVTPYPVPHDSMDCVAFRIEYQGMTLCVLTDVGHVTDELKPLVGAADHLIIEANHDSEMLMAGPYPEYLKARIAGGAGHLSNHHCADLLREQAGDRLRNVWLCHLSEENNHPELARKTVEAALRDRYGAAGGPALHVLPRRVPSPVYTLEGGA